LLLSDVVVAAVSPIYGTKQPPAVEAGCSLAGAQNYDIHSAAG